MSAISVAAPPRQFELSRMFRPHLLAIPRYVTSTSDEKQDRVAIALDANENSAGSSLQEKDEFGEAGISFRIDDMHRYPSASQRELKEGVVQWRSLQSTDQICVGSGASDLVDLLIRATCVPGSDKILVTPPTFELYRVCAGLHDVGVVVSLQQLTEDGMHVSAEDVCQKLASDAAIKVVFLASPGNPTGGLVALNTIQRILDEPTFGGLVVVDEAYIDFADAPDRASALTLLSQYRNLVVVQSLSKSHGLAGLRVGVALAHPSIIEILHKIQMPFKIGSIALRLASKALDPTHRTRQQERIASVREERTRLLATIRRPCWASVLQPLLGQSDPAANFVTVIILAPETGRPDDHRAKTLVAALKSRFAISVRYVGMQPLCTGCVRITVGTSTEVDLLTAALHELLLEQHGPP